MSQNDSERPATSATPPSRREFLSALAGVLQGIT